VTEKLAGAARCRHPGALQPALHRAEPEERQSAARRDGGGPAAPAHKGGQQALRADLEWCLVPILAWRRFCGVMTRWILWWSRRAGPDVCVSERTMSHFSIWMAHVCHALLVLH